MKIKFFYPSPKKREIFLITKLNMIKTQDVWAQDKIFI